MDIQFTYKFTPSYAYILLNIISVHSHLPYIIPYLPYTYLIFSRQKTTGVKGTSVTLVTADRPAVHPRHQAVPGGPVDGRNPRRVDLTLRVHGGHHEGGHGGGGGGSARPIARAEEVILLSPTMEYCALPQAVAGLPPLPLPLGPLSPLDSNTKTLGHK